MVNQVLRSPSNCDDKNMSRMGRIEEIPSDPESCCKMIKQTLLCTHALCRPVGSNELAPITHIYCSWMDDRGMAQSKWLRLCFVQGGAFGALCVCSESKRAGLYRAMGMIFEVQKPPGCKPVVECCRNDFIIDWDQDLGPFPFFYEKCSASYVEVNESGDTLGTFA